MSSCCSSMASAGRMRWRLVLERMLHTISQPWMSPQGDFNVDVQYGRRVVSGRRHEYRDLVETRRPGDVSRQGKRPQQFSVLHSRAERAHHGTAGAGEQIASRVGASSSSRCTTSLRVDMRTRRITGAEALIRWHASDRRSHAAVAIYSCRGRNRFDRADRQVVLRAACAQNKAWQDAGLPPFVVSVNVSVRQFRQDNLVQTIAEVLRDTGLEARYLEVGAHRKRGHARRRAIHRHARPAQRPGRANRARRLRHRLFQPELSETAARSIDSKWTARSCRTSVTTTTTRPSCRAIIALGHNLGLKVVAEGVETEQQIDFLRANQCDELQGYYFGRPMPGEEFMRVLLDLKAPEEGTDLFLRR